MKLYAHQARNADILERSLREYRIAVDASDTGTGKTYTACEVARRIACPVLVVCPKAVIPSWQRSLAALGVSGHVVNYEKLRIGNTPFVKRDGKNFRWVAANDTLIVWDEAHRAKSPTSQIAKMVAAAKSYRNLLLSATLAQSPIDMRALGYLLGLHTWNNYMNWCLRNGCWRPPWGGLAFKDSAKATVLPALHEQIFSEKGVRTRHSDIPDFPETLISAESYDMGPDIKKIYDELGEELKELAGKATYAEGFAVELRARQHAELCKVPAIAGMAEDEIEEGNSVVIFVNFSETREQLCARLKCESIYGGDKDRQGTIDRFQNDEIRVIVVQIQAGGVGLSLHDVNGVYPRVALICPTYNAVELRQALGRVHRAGGKSRSIQRIIFAAGTIEESVCENVRKKLTRIDALNDGDLSLLSLNASSASVSDGFMTVSSTSTPTCEKPANPPTASQTTPSSCTSPAATPIDTASTPDSSGKTPTGDGKPAAPVASIDESSSRKHAKHGPSSLKNKMVCPGWRGIQGETNKWAERGTLGHAAVENENPSMCGADANLKAAAEMCLSYRAGLIKPGTRSYKEIKLWMVGQFGYADEVLVTEQHADVLDWKFTSNKYSADSPQFWAYAVGTWDRFAEVETVTAHVAHPFLEMVSIETWSRETDYERLSAILLSIVTRAEACDPKTFTPFSGCQYCANLSTCPSIAKLGAEVATRYEGKDYSLPEGSLHGSQITDPAAFSALLRIKSILETACGGWSRAALELHDAGNEVPGYELRETSGRRTITAGALAYSLVAEKFGVEPHEWADVCDPSIGKVEDLIKAKAAKGKGAEAVREFRSLLAEHDIVSYGAGGRFLTPSKS